MARETPVVIEFPCIRVRQRIGEFYIAAIDSRDLYKISWADVRRIKGEKRDVETYLGIQRPLNDARVDELQLYVKTEDACFPTAVILAVPGVCATYDESRSVMRLSNYLDEEDESNDIIFGKIAKVLDGQHRIEGLRYYEGEPFEVNVSIFVDIDIAEQAYIFSTVNLAQTKVNKSLVYDLYDLAKSRSPQKVCHHIAVALDAHKDSPLYHRIKRLGVATEGRFGETITQATFVESLLRYMTKNKKTAIQDRDEYMKGRLPSSADPKDADKLILRQMLLDERDMEIADIIWNYFEAVSRRWPTAWAASGRGLVLNKTNGFRALMRFFRDAYLYVASPGQVPTVEEFHGVFDKINMDDDSFTVERYKPGTSGESALYRDLIERGPMANLS